MFQQFTSEQSFDECEKLVHEARMKLAAAAMFAVDQRDGIVLAERLNRCADKIGDEIDAWPNKLSAAKG